MRVRACTALCGARVRFVTRFNRTGPDGIIWTVEWSQQNIIYGCFTTLLKYWQIPDSGWLCINTTAFLKSKRQNCFWIMHRNINEVVVAGRVNGREGEQLIWLLVSHGNEADWPDGQSSFILVQTVNSQRQRHKTACAFFSTSSCIQKHYARFAPVCWFACDLTCKQFNILTLRVQC